MQSFFVSIFCSLALLCSYANAEMVSGLAWIEPAGGVIDLAGPGGDVVKEINVKPGQKVKQGQELASFYGTTQMQLQLQTEQVQQKLTHKLSEQAIAMQKLTIQSAKNDVTNAKLNYDSYKNLDTKAIVNRQLETRKYQLEQAKIHLTMAQERLKELQITQQLDEDIAKNSIQRTQQQLERVSLKAPVNGEILTVDASPGESSSRGPILTMANLQHMVAICEVPEDDLIRIQPGQQANIESPSLPAKISGQVLNIQRIINQRLRVGHVTVKLDNPELAARFINMQVTFKITL